MCLKPVSDLRSLKHINLSFLIPILLALSHLSLCPFLFSLFTFIVSLVTILASSCYPQQLYMLEMAKEGWLKSSMRRPSNAEAPPQRMVHTFGVCGGPPVEVAHLDNGATTPLKFLSHRRILLSGISSHTWDVVKDPTLSMGTFRTFHSVMDTKFMYV